MERTKKWTKKTDAHLETNQDLRSGPITARLWRTRERLKTFASVNRVTGIRNREKRQGIWEKWKANWDISTARIKTGERERERGRRLRTVLALPSRSLHLEAGPSIGCSQGHGVWHDGGRSPQPARVTAEPGARRRPLPARITLAAGARSRRVSRRRRSRPQPPGAGDGGGGRARSPLRASRRRRPEPVAPCARVPAAAAGARRAGRRRRVRL